MIFWNQSALLLLQALIQNWIEDLYKKILQISYFLHQEFMNIGVG